MTQNAIGELRMPGGRSSAMPHKQNPVGAELLVVLSRFATHQMGGLLSAALHENERSGTAWTLEWLALPPIILAGGVATSVAETLLSELQLPLNKLASGAGIEPTTN